MKLQGRGNLKPINMTHESRFKKDRPYQTKSYEGIQRQDAPMIQIGSTD